MSEKQQEPMSDERLQEIEKRHESSTSGEWVSAAYGMAVGSGWQIICNFMNGPVTLRDFGPNSEFIAHAHQDVPDLIAEVKRLRDENAELSFQNDLYVFNELGFQSMLVQSDETYQKLTGWKEKAQANIETAINLWPHIEDVLEKGLI